MSSLYIRTIRQVSGMSHNIQKKIAAINDLTGFGRCALTVSIPVISHMKIQCCPIPTSILSNHTGYQKFFFDDYTDKLPDYIGMWERLDLKFEGIMSGFLGSKEQISIVEHFIDRFRTERTLVIIDPVMGDHGVLYSTYTEEMCREMRKLITYADIITPNLTEACKLTDTMFKEYGWKKKELLTMSGCLNDMGPEKIVITGIPQGDFIANFVYERGKEPKMLRTHTAGTSRCGTGDLFAAIIAADAVNGVEFSQSVKKASGFVKNCILKSIELGIDQNDGVCFEELLGSLRV